VGGTVTGATVVDEGAVGAGTVVVADASSGAAGGTRSSFLGGAGAFLSLLGG
jgi:hypothetical protein